MDLFKGLSRVRSRILIADHLIFHENELLIHKKDLEVKRVPGGDMIPFCDGKTSYCTSTKIRNIVVKIMMDLPDAPLGVKDLYLQLLGPLIRDCSS